MAERRRGIHEDSIETLLDKVSGMREELLSIERSLERLQAHASDLPKRKDRSGKKSRTEP
jgi:hypothetical protein